MPQQKSETEKQTYTKPELIEFGDIEKLTQGTAGSLADGTHLTRK